MNTDIETLLNEADIYVVLLFQEGKIPKKIQEYLDTTNQTELLIKIFKSEPYISPVSAFVYQDKWYVLVRPQLLLPETVCDLTIGYQEITAHYSRLRWVPMETCQEFCSFQRKLSTPEYPDDWGNHVFVWGRSTELIELYSATDIDLSITYYEEE